MTVEEYRNRLMDAFHNADCDELIAVVVRPEESEFEQLEWLLKNHYHNQKQQSCEDCRNCKKWNKCPCGKEGHENGTSIGYSIGECKNYEPCEEAVSRQAVLEVLKKNRYRFNISQEGYCAGKVLWSENLIKDDAYKEIEQLPSVTPKEKTGKWEMVGMLGGDVTYYRCSECNELFWIENGKPKDNKYNYCPNCGARMVSE